MNTTKFKHLLSELEFAVGGDPVEWLDARQKLTQYVSNLEEMLKWYIDTDEIHEGDPENQYWIDGKHKAMKLLGMEVEE